VIRKLLRYLHQLRALQRVNMSLARGSVSRGARTLDMTRPSTWEFSGFSQNGEDGIIEVLVDRIRDPNRYFIEIGASDGLENNTSWLSLTRRWAGVWVEGDPDTWRRGVELFAPLNYGVHSMQLFVTRQNLSAILAKARMRNPDLFSLDIDGNDFHFALELFRQGLRPAVCVVEYNSAYGPDRAVSVPYAEDFRVMPGPGSNLFYGCSLAGWHALFETFGYRFVTVDSNGVNAFFVNPERFDAAFLDAIQGRAFSDSTSHAREYGGTWKEQSALLAGRPLVDITPETFRR
jgi:hypothetical protein